MDTLKPLFIFAALGIVTAVVYTAVSRSPESDELPPHVEGLAVPQSGAPLVQMPTSPSLGAPFGASPPSNRPPAAQDGSSYAPAAAAGPDPGHGASIPVQPGPSPYPHSGFGQAPASPYPAPAHYNVPAGRNETSISAYAEASGEMGEDPRVRPASGTSACGSECTISGPPFHTGADRAGADAPAWPAAQAAAGLAPSYDPPGSDHDTGAARYDRPPASRRDFGLMPDRGHSHHDTEQGFQRLMDEVYRKLDAGRLAEAHRELSRLYRDPGLTAQQARQVVELLDQLAGTVIFSRQSLLEPPYVVRPGDTLQSIADQYDVPPELIANINGIRDPRGVQPGQELKVVRGPFYAMLHLGDYELSLMLGDLYAGRFRVGLGREQPELEGNYIVTYKGAGPTYYGADGVTIEAHDPRNPLGHLWIGLGKGYEQPAHIGIHGTNDPQNIGRAAPRCHIALDRRDIEDVYGILSIGSRVIIRR